MFSLSHVETLCSYFQIISKLVSVNSKQNRALKSPCKIKRIIIPFFAQTLYLSPISLSSQFMLTLSWTGHSIRSGPARRVRSDNIFVLTLKIKVSINLKILRAFFSLHFSWIGNKGHLTRASNISFGPFYGRSAHGGYYPWRDHPSLWSYHNIHVTNKPAHVLVWLSYIRFSLYIVKFPFWPW
jgi:hypothetical protein